MHETIKMRVEFCSLVSTWNPRRRKPRRRKPKVRRTMQPEEGSVCDGGERQDDRAQLGLIRNHVWYPCGRLGKWVVGL